MKIDEEQMKLLLEELKPSIMEGYKKEIQKVVENKIKWEFEDVIGKFTRDWISENIIPELQKELIESKEGMIRLGVVFAEDIVNELSVGLTKHMKEQLENSWSRKKMLQALFT